LFTFPPLLFVSFIFSSTSCPLYSISSIFTHSPCRFYPLPQIFILLVPCGGVRLSPLGTSSTNWPMYRPRIIDNKCGAVGGMRIGRTNRSTLRKTAPAPLRRPQTLHDLTWARIHAITMRNRRLTAF
jgi:hypothetical protein